MMISICDNILSQNFVLMNTSFMQISEKGTNYFGLLQQDKDWQQLFIEESPIYAEIKQF